MDDVRTLVLPDTTKPDPTVLSGFFSVNRKDPAKQKQGPGGTESKKPNPPNPKPPDPPPPAKAKPFHIADLDDGFSVSANPVYSSFPASFRLEVAYANGERRPKWSPFDFELQKLSVTQRGSIEAIEVEGNVLKGTGCGPDFSFEIKGFDTRRELSVILTEIEADA
jgi:hypothetical protein